MSNTNVVYLLLNTTSHLQPLDGGIILAFKGGYRKLLIFWVIAELDNERAASAQDTRPTMKLAIEWIQYAWANVTPNTIKNCFNKGKILPAVQSVGRDDCNVLQELEALLVDFSTTHESLQIEDVVNPSDEQWTEAPVESDDEDTELVEAIQVLGKLEDNDADDSTEHIPV
jgi:hypothetical protein